MVEGGGYPYGTRMLSSPPYFFFDLYIIKGRPPDKSVYQKIIFIISQPKHVVGTQKNCLNEAVLLSTQNLCLDCWVKNNDNFTLKIFA